MKALLSTIAVFAVLGLSACSESYAEFHLTVTADADVARQASKYYSWNAAEPQGEPHSSTMTATGGVFPMSGTSGRDEVTAASLTDYYAEVYDEDDELLSTVSLSGIRVSFDGLLRVELEICSEPATYELPRAALQGDPGDWPLFRCLCSLDAVTDGAICDTVEIGQPD